MNKIEYEKPEISVDELEFFEDILSSSNGGGSVSGGFGGGEELELDEWFVFP